MQQLPALATIPHICHLILHHRNLRPISFTLGIVYICGKSCLAKKSVCKILHYVIKECFCVPIRNSSTRLNLITQPTIVMAVAIMRCAGSHGKVALYCNAKPFQRLLLASHHHLTLQPRLQVSLQGQF